MTDRDDELLARRYRELRREVPSPALDARVLAAARDAVAPRSFARRWAAPLSAAAVVVLGVGVALQVQREQGKPMPAPEQAAAPMPMKARAEPAAPPTAAAPAEIPFAPRRPLEARAGSPEAKGEAEATAPAPAAANIAPPARAPFAKGALTAPPTDAARAQREAADAIGRYGILSGGAQAQPSGALSGPFSIDEATSAGVNVKIVNPP